MGKSYGQSGWDQINDAVLTKDTGVVMVGQLFDSITQSMNLYVIRRIKAEIHFGQKHRRNGSG